MKIITTVREHGKMNVKYEYCCKGTEKMFESNDNNPLWDALIDGEFGYCPWCGVKIESEVTE